MFSCVAEDEWKYKSEGIASLKMPTMLCDTLRHDDIMWEGYRPKMLLYALDELFYIYDQVKCHRGIDEKIVVAYEIKSRSAALCEAFRMSGVVPHAGCHAVSESE